MLKVKEKGDKIHDDWQMFFSDFVYFLQLIRRESTTLHEVEWNQNLCDDFVSMRKIILQCIDGTLTFKKNRQERCKLSSMIETAGVFAQTYIYFTLMGDKKSCGPLKECTHGIEYLSYFFLLFWFFEIF